MMYKEKIYTFLGILFCLGQLAGQTLRGHVYVNRRPVNSAEILITDQEQKKYFTVTGETGEFSIDLPGKKNYTVKAFSEKKLIISKNIYLDGNATEDLYVENKEIEIKSVDLIVKKKKIIQQKADRIIFNIENSIIASGGDVMDAIRLAPRISVQNDDIKITGKGKILVMMDGRPINIQKEDLPSYLKSIKSDEISSIEVITNPPAKYTAEGNSGIINIVTRKSKKDYWNLSLNTTAQAASKFMYKNGANYNLNYKDITLSSSVNYTGGYNAPVNYSRIEYPDITWIEDNKQTALTDNLSARLSLDYKLNKKITTGIQYIGSFSSPKVESNIDSKIFGKPIGNEKSLINTSSVDSKNNRFNSLNYHIIYQIDTIGKKISFDFDYFNSKSRSRQNYISKTFDKMSPFPDIPGFESGKNEGFQNINNYSLNLDVEHPTPWAILNYGTRISFVNTSNDINFYDLSTGNEYLDFNRSNQFSFREKNQSLYFSMNKELGEKWEFQTGLRMESTQTKGVSETLNQKSEIKYTKLFPTAYVLYKINTNNQLSANYGRRIHRPEFSLLNPFKYTFSPYSTSEGNPYLLPEFTNNIELTYNYKDFMITSLYYSDLKDGFEMLTIMNTDTKIQTTTPLNFISNRSYGVNQYFYLKLFPWLNANLNINLFNSQSKSSSPVTLSYLNGWNFETKADLNFILNKKKTFFFGLNTWQVSKGVNNLDRSSSGYQIDASLKLFLMDKKLQMVCYVNDIFKSNKISYTGFSNNNQTTYRNYEDLRFIRLSVIYNFGNKSIKDVSREVKNSDEKDRAVFK
ncbi:TonB-dependent receptor domain-containing protein [Chryseobacterium sp. SIMBA_028]|uniref:TonB-dependent receptor domain-containing protein n=2 Tax=Bacteria TaxID=2 RepID=UPI003979A5BD